MPATPATRRRRIGAAGHDDRRRRLGLGTFTIAGLLKADDGSQSIIENFDTISPAVTFTNDGTILVTGSDTTLTLNSDVLDDYVDAGGSIQVGNASDASDATPPELELQGTTIDGGGLGTFTIAGLLKADDGSQSIIENFDTISPAVTFTNDGTILVTGSDTTLTLNSDVLDDYVGTAGGSIQVGNAATPHRRRRLELQGTTIDGGGLGTAARYGGDEFLALLPECQTGDVQYVLKRLEGVQANVGGQMLPVSYSAGWADYIPGESYEELLERADKALYDNKRAAKARGKPSVVSA